MPETRPDSRFAADVDYRGRAGEHDYVVHARHRLLDTSFTVTIDGVEHDPAAEQKARAAAEKAKAASGSAEEGSGDRTDEAESTGEGSEGRTDESGSAAEDGDKSSDGGEADGDDRADSAPADDGGTGTADGAGPDGDGLQFSVEEGFTTLRCTVRRPRAEGGHKDAEVITIRTAGLGGAGEVEIRHGFRTTVLVPQDGSPSAARDAKRTAHPTRYALIAAATKSVRYLAPLLGIGALLSGLLDPLFAWIEERVRPVVEAVAEATEPVREWVAQLLQPVRDFLAALWQPVVDLIAAVLRPVRDLVAWLLGLLPDLGLPFDLPDWLFEVVIAVIVVVAVFSATRSGLRERREKLAETRTRHGRTGEGRSAQEEPTETDEAGEGTQEVLTGTDEAGEGTQEGLTGSDEAGEGTQKESTGTGESGADPGVTDAFDRGGQRVRETAADPG